MGRYVFFCLMLIAITCPKWAVGQQGCGQACQTLNDCEGQLICTNGKCNDDPDVGTHICSATPSPTGGGTCQQSGTLQGKDGNCDTSDGSECCKSSKKYATYTCSPPVSSQTAADLTLNGFGEGESGGGASECDGQFHKNSELIVALSTGWFDNRSRCGKQIRISANSKSVLAKVVDECDSTVGCDKEHDFQQPCHNNIVDGWSAVWSALGLNQDLGKVPVTWSDAS